MEKLILKQTTLNQALEQLKTVINDYEKNNMPLEFAHGKEYLREAMMQRFEYSCELFWRFIKAYLDFAHGAVPAESGARSIIRAACKIGILSESETGIIMEMIEDRNKNSHMYLESVALQIAKHIPTYAELMQKITSRIILKVGSAR